MHITVAINVKNKNNVRYLFKMLLIINLKLNLSKC